MTTHKKQPSLTLYDVKLSDKNLYRITVRQIESGFELLNYELKSFNGKRFLKNKGAIMPEDVTNICNLAREKFAMLQGCGIL